MHGYAGRILWINLSRNEVRAEGINENVARLFIGGRGGLGLKIIFDLNLNLNGVDPYGPENPLIIATGGPLGGTRMPLATRPLPYLNHRLRIGGVTQLLVGRSVRT